MSITKTEIELLASLLTRAGMTQIETIWANSVLDRLRVIVAGPTQQELQTALKEAEDAKPTA